MDFDLSSVQVLWQEKGAALGREVERDALRSRSGGPEHQSRGAVAASVVMSAARVGLLDPAADLLAVAAAVEAMARESAVAAVIFALHSATALALAHLRQGRVAARPDDPVLAGRSAFADRSGGQAGDGRFSSLFSGETVAAVGLASDDVPLEQDGRLSGRASWVAPITDRGLAVVGPRRGGQPKLHARAEERAAYAVFFDTPGLTIEVVETAGLPGLVCGHVAFSGTVGEPIGAPLPVMTRIRIFMAAAGIGMGRRALDEALIAAKATHAAAAGEQTVQGLLADAATELDAATLMVWKAAGGEPVSLADASLAKLMATEAALRAVEHATQVIGADSFQRGHIIERLAQDVRALELFAGRTEALREAVAEEILPLGVSLVPVPRKGEMTS